MPTRFKLDENLPRNAEILLQQTGHDVHTVLAEQLGGNPDPHVFGASQVEEFSSRSISISPISAFILQQITMASGYCVPTHKVYREYTGFVAIRVANS